MTQTILSVEVALHLLPVACKTLVNDGPMRWHFHDAFQALNHVHSTTHLLHHFLAWIGIDDAAKEGFRDGVHVSLRTQEINAVSAKLATAKPVPDSRSVDRIVRRTQHEVMREVMVAASRQNLPRVVINQF